MFCLQDEVFLRRLVIVAVSVSLFPLIAFLYSAIVWFSYSFYREIRWTHPKSLQSLLFRWMFVVFSWVAAIGAASLCSTCEDYTMNSNTRCIAGTTALVTALLMGASIHLIIQTRREDVVGVDKRPFYGSSCLHGKFMIVTGSNNGIGKETARQLAAQGATVVMLCRNAIRAKRAMADIRELQAFLHNEDPVQYPTPRVHKDQLIFVPLDLTDFDSIRQAVKAVKQHLELRSTKSQKQEFVDALVCNAGLMMGTQSTTKNGLETMMQANHLGHFLLMKMMLDGNMLKTTASSSDQNDEPSRVCILTSSTYEFSASTSGFDFEDPFCSNGQRPYTLFGQYSMTKLANLLTAKELARRYNKYDNENDEDDEKSALAVFAVHPGIVRTNVTSNMNWYYRLPNKVFGWIVVSLSKTAEQGAYSTVHVTSAPLRELQPSGVWKKGSYLVNCKEQPAHEYVAGQSGVEDAKRLWNWSEQLVSNKEGEGSANATNGNDDGEKKEQ